MGTVIDCLQRQNEGRPDTVSVMGLCGKRLHLYMCRYSDKWMQFGLFNSRYCHRSDSTWNTTE